MEETGGDQVCADSHGEGEAGGMEGEAGQGCWALSALLGRVLRNG